MSLLPKEILPGDEIGIQFNPFPGIRNFEPEEDYLFFGRETQIREIQDILAEKRFLALIGYSGSGKSSLIKAGLLPSITKGKMLNTARPNWKIIYFRPENKPFQAFAAALNNTFESDGNAAGEDMEETASFLQLQVQNLQTVYQKYSVGEDQSWLIVVDQFEELFQFHLDDKDASFVAQTQQFINLLLSGLEEMALPVYLILSMRSDFLDNCTEFAGLPEAINKGSYLLPKVAKSGIRDIIVQPILVCGGRITDDLVEKLLADVEDNLDQLPILQHALMRTWDYWKLNSGGEEPLAVSHYEAIGTMGSALSLHAEDVFSALSNERLQKLTEKLFKALTDVTLDNKGTRRPVQLKSLVKLANATEQDVVDVIEEFRAPGRAFLIPNYKVSLSGDTFINITHESLMRVWQRLKEWVEEETRSAELYLRLSKSAALYQQGKTGLWINPDLALAINWQQEQQPNAAWAGRYDPAFDRAMNFLEYSKKEAQFEIEQKENKQKRDLKRTRAFLVILGAAAFISLVLFMYSFNERIKATASAKEAQENAKAAFLASKQAAQERKEALLQQQIAKQQQEITEQERLISDEQRAFALHQKEIAVLEKDRADSAKKVAQEQRLLALTQKKIAENKTREAEYERKVATSAKNKAETEQKRAEESEREAQRLRLLSIARALAVESTKMNLTANRDLAALLALQAHIFNQQNGGFANDANIFSALSDVADDKPVLRRHQDAVRSIALSGDGAVLASASDDGTVKIWHRAASGTFQMVQPLPTGEVKSQEIRSLALSPDGQYLMAGVVDGRLIKWNLHQRKPQPQVIAAHQQVINKILFDPQQNQFITVSSDGFMKMWNLTSAHVPQFTYNVNSPVLTAALSTSNKIACGSKDGRVTVFNLGNLTEPPEQSVADTKAIRAIAFDREGKLLVTGNADGSIKVWAVKNNKRPITEIIGHHSGINAIVFNPTNKTFATCSYDKTIRVWTLEALKENPIVLDDYDSWVMDLAFTPDGNDLVAAGADKTIRIFRLNQLDLAQQLCLKTHRNLTNDEWEYYIAQDINYQKTCLHNP